jgi:flagellar biosynthesis/type III secretory pathway protein FliH
MRIYKKRRSKEYDKGFSEGYEKGFKRAVMIREKLDKVFEPLKESVEKLKYLNEIN